jgi:hypothetical protein
VAPIGSPALRVLSEASPVRPRRINAPFIGNNRLRNSPAGGRASASATREPVRGENPEEGGNWFACVREKRAAPSAPRSWALAATLFGSLRPGSFRVHDPCNEMRHGSRLGFPGRRPPRGPATSANVARDLQVLPQQARRVSAEGRGELGLDPAEPGLRRPGSRRRSGAQVGVAILLPHDSLCAEVRGCTRSTHGIVPPGKTHSPSASGLSYARGRGGCCNRISRLWNFPPRGDVSRSGARKVPPNFWPEVRCPMSDV